MEIVKRPDWDHFWFVQATMYSTRGTCDRLRAGCIIVKDKRLIGAGYNGSPAGAPHCDDVGHQMIEGHCQRALHAEENAILNSDRNLCKDAVAYVTVTPCMRCAKLLVGAGIKEIKYLGVYENASSDEYLRNLEKDTGVKFIKCNYNPRSLIEESIKVLEGRGGILFQK